MVTAFFLVPWWARNFHYTGNPVAPFFMQIFGGEDGINWDSHRSALQFQYYQSFGMGRGLMDFLLLPVNLPNNVYSFFPLQFEMIYLFCLMLKGDALAQLAGLGMALILLASLVLFYRRYLSTKGASLVSVLFFSVPAFWSIAPAAYVDLPVAGFIFLTSYAWSRWRL